MIHNDISAFTLMKPSRFTLLKSFSFERSINGDRIGNFDVEIVLTALKLGEVGNMRLQFSNVFDLKIGNDSHGFTGLQVEIDDVSTWQIEGAKFKVSEVEEAAFSFYCKAFFAEMI